MQGHITVILIDPVSNITESLDCVLEEYDSNGPNWKDITSHCWDWWYPFAKAGCSDTEIATKHSTTNPETLAASCYVRDLPEHYITSGVILEGGKWIDLQDFGWRMMSEPSEENSTAAEIWRHELKRILDDNKNNLCVQIILHC